MAYGTLVPWPGIEPRAPCIGKAAVLTLDSQGGLEPILTSVLPLYKCE